MLFWTVLLLVQVLSIINVDLTGYFQDKIPNLDFNIEGGYASANNKLFYLVTYKRGTINDIQYGAPLILWLNGGPGCSSQNNLYQDVGPLEVTQDENKKFKFQLRSSSWNQHANLLFIDQPYGAGYSHSPNITVNSTEIAMIYLIDMLEQFYTTHRQLEQSPLYLFGVSYAGHFIPALGRSILKKLPHLNYKGIGLGDPWVSPIDQIGHYDQFLYSTGLVDEFRRSQLSRLQSVGTQALLKGDFAEASHSFSAIINSINNYTGDVNLYNFHNYTSVGPDAPFVQFLNTDEYKKILGVPLNITYQLCSDQIQQDFSQDFSTTRKQDIEFLLLKGRVLIYTGQNDIVVTSSGIQAFINSLKWEKLNEFKKQKKEILKINNDVVGWIKSFSELSQVTIYDAGHFVPYDQPDAALLVLKNFLEYNLQ